MPKPRTNDYKLTTNTIMNNEKPQSNLLPWTTPELTILSICRDTEQLPPPDNPAS
jgi:hypothetical protein